MDELVKSTISVVGLFSKQYMECILRLEYPALVGTFIATLILIYNTVDDRFRELFMLKIRFLPLIGRLVQGKIRKALLMVHESVHRNAKILYEINLPEKGFSVDIIMQKIRKYKAAEYIRWKEGFASGSVYANDENLTNLAAKTFREFAWSNPLHPDLFPDIRRMEAEVVRMCATMFKGDAESCGSVTSGGTESVMLACLAYRELARERGIRKPVILVPESAHPAFDKAAHYFCMKLIKIPVDKNSMKVNLSAMKRSITRDTCMLVGSAPGFPHGVIDPIAGISQLGVKYGIPVHVDCCLGGFLLPFMEKADCLLDEPFDFRLAGVTSISCDTHKYGFAVKGTSVILYRNSEYRSKQYFTQPNWSGGVYASPTFAGSRPGSLIATCWAAMMYHGVDGYVRSTRRIVNTTRFIAKSLQKIPGLFVYGDPKVCVVAFGSHKFDIYRLSEELSKLPNGRGWILNNLQFPPALHICVTEMHTVEGRAESFVRDVASVAATLSDQPRTENSKSASIYGMSAMIPDRSIVSELARGFLDACYDTPTFKEEENR